MSNTVQNVKVTSDISQFEQGAKNFAALIGVQTAAISNLMVKQIEFNRQQKASKAVVEAQISDNVKLIAQLRQKNGEWVVAKGRVVENTKALSDNARERERLLKLIEKERNSIGKGPPGRGNDGGRGLLGPMDFARIAEATLFKSALTAVTSSISDGISKAKEYQIQISLIRTVSQEAQLSFTQWSEGIRDVSNRLGIDLVETAKAAYQAVQSQVVKGAQTLDFLRTAGELARTTGANIMQSQDLLSSVIQGFKLSVIEADQVAASLFKTIELGRIKVDELVPAMGRIGPMAGVIGVRLQEVEAALSTLTRQGIKTSDATTLVSNVIIKLAKPTEGMAKLLRSWGFESGQAAVKTLGFVEVIRRLEQVTNGSLPEIAELFNEIRALRGATGLTSAFKDFEEDLAKLDNAETTYQRAMEIRAESSADRITKFNNAAKNTFIVAYGQSAVGYIDTFISKLGDGDKAAAVFANSVLGIGTVLLGGKAALIAYGAATNQLNGLFLIGARNATAATAANVAYGQAIGAGLSRQQAATVAQIAHNKAKLEFVATSKQAAAAQAMSNKAMVGLGGTIIGLGLIWQAYTEKVEQTITDQANLNRIFEETQRITSQQTRSIAQQNLDQFTREVNQIFDAPLRASADRLREVNGLLSQQEGIVKRSAEAFELSYKNAIDDVRKVISEMNKQITDADRRIRESTRSTTTFRETLDDIIRKTQMQYASDAQRIPLIRQEIARLTREAEADYARGDEESVRRARERVNDIARLEQDAFNHEQEQRRRAAEQYGDRSQGPITLNVSTVELQRRLNALAAQRAGWERNIVTSLETQRTATAEQLAERERAMRAFEQAGRNLANFTVYNQSGGIADEFMTGGVLDMNKVRAAVNRLQTAVFDQGRILVAQRALTEEALLRLSADNARRVADLQVQANLEANRQMLAQDQNRLTALRDGYLRRFRELQQFSATFSADVFSNQGILDRLGANNQSINDLVNVSPGTLTRIFGIRTNSNQTNWGEVEREQATLRERKTALDLQLQAIRQNATRDSQGQLIPRAEDIQAAIAALRQVEAQAERVARAINPQGNPQDLASIGPGGRATRLGDAFADTNRMFQQMIDGNDRLQGITRDFAALREELRLFQEQAVNPLLGAFPQMTEQLQGTAITGVRSFYSELVIENEKGIKAVQRLIDLYRQIPSGSTPQPRQDIPPLNPANNNSSSNVGPNGILGGNESVYLASGGIVGMHPGAPKGTDTIPAWLSRGEMVINAAATKKFYAQLVQMNAGVQPKYYARGGYVTNNIGDIHVHMEGNNQPSASRAAREIGRELRREIRRGNIKLN